MVQQLLNHIQRHNLCKTNDKILLAVSGGIDSMVMLHLFKSAGYVVGVAHCNFQLRGESSQADEVLVNQVCVSLGIPFHGKRFDTKTIAEKNKESIQVTARKLRYEYFQELVTQFGYNFIATAHHLNDNLETVLHHLIRGTGIDGVAGIPVKNGNVIRPILFATRDDIQKYASFHRLEWREDESNQHDEYSRNYIRHHVVPHLKVLNPALENTFTNSVERLNAVSVFFHKEIKKLKDLFLRSGENTIIRRNLLTSYDYPEVILWELIKEMGFTFEQCRLIVKEHQPGKVFFAGAKKLTVDRDVYILNTLTRESIESVEIEQSVLSVNNLKQQIDLEVIPARDFQLNLSADLAQLDYDLIKYPLTWRKWQAGDSFKPLGMSHQKKISDFLIDMKISLPDKENVTLLESEGEIVWVVGHRISEKFKVTSKTLNVLIIRVQPV